MLKKVEKIQFPHIERISIGFYTISFNKISSHTHTSLHFFFQFSHRFISLLLQKDYHLKPLKISINERKFVI